ncbi:MULTISPECIES: hypothetical protein [unclassified Bradyrhizobium]
MRQGDDTGAADEHFGVLRFKSSISQLGPRSFDLAILITEAAPTTGS